MKIFRKNRITRASIKEGFDNLPSGICFADKNGIIILCNRQMHRLCNAFLGTDVQHIFELRAVLKSPPQEILMIDTVSSVYRLPDGDVWQFSETELKDEYGKRYTQVMAANVTTLYEKETELEQENQLLSEMNARAVRLYSELDKIVREEENFAIKTRVHDEVGMALMQTRRLLTKPSSLSEMKKLGVDWCRIAYTLGVTTNEPQSSDTADELDNLPGIIAGIGVKLIVNGILPQDKATAYLLNVAIREGAINAVRHAGGTELFVDIERHEGAYYVFITNNGKMPNGEIKEGGGLSALRNRIEAAGGKMVVESQSIFRLCLTLPGKE